MNVRSSRPQLMEAKKSINKNINVTPGLRTCSVSEASKPRHLSLADALISCSVNQTNNGESKKNC